jgi:hypothetical protein
MNASRILPDLQASLLCEDVRVESSGNFIIVGVISEVRVPQLPIAAYKLCVFNRWTAGIGEFNQEVRLVAPDGTTVLRKSAFKFALQNPAQNTTNVSVFGQVEFKEQGTYTIEVLIDDVMKLRVPVPVILVQQKQQPPKGAQPPAQ